MYALFFYHKFSTQIACYIRQMLVKLNLPMHNQRLKMEGGQQLIFCQVRKKFLVLTPEEWVRQNLVSYLQKDLSYPLSLMKIERQVKGGQRTKRADLIICNTQGEPQLLIECKAASEKLNKETFFQLGRYNHYINAPLLVISNGLEHYCCTLTTNNEFEFLESIPAYVK
tara:strand:- start:32 stop:538 length:507 start_codon:yes stop_codon:yes gene_type:complete